MDSPRPHNIPPSLSLSQSARDEREAEMKASYSGDAESGLRGRRRREEWSRAFLLVCCAGLVIDPLFFYTLSISGSGACLYIDGWFALSATALRCAADALHIWLYLARRLGAEAAEDGARKSPKGFFFDVFVLLPFLQVMMWGAAPAMMRGGAAAATTTAFLVAFLVQYIPRVYYCVRLLRRTQKLDGYVFGTVRQGLVLNLIAYFLIAHAAGACWYLLGIQRATRCLEEQGMAAAGREGAAIACEGPVFYGTTALVKQAESVAWEARKSARDVCLSGGGNYDYGSYEWTVALFTSPSRVEKILLPLFWALMTISTFGNLNSTTQWLEVLFNIVIITSGLILVTMLIGNIKLFMDSVSSTKQEMKLKLRNMERWMRRRRLPQSFRRRVRQCERQRWAAMRGIDECEIVGDLPDGLRREIKYRLCLDLVRQVPLFHHMDSMVLDMICDRIKPLVFSKGETIAREGEPVQRMLFVVRGHLQSSQELRDGLKSSCMLGPGNFTGDELLSWCLRRPFVDRLPPSSATLQTLETTEAFALDAADVKYVTQHFRHTFINDKVRRSARYYSPGWRTWAAVAIQLAWRRHRHRLTLASLSFILPRRPPSRSSSMGEDKLRLYAAILTSPKPTMNDF